MELPRVRIEVTDHLFVERRCGVCKKRWTPDPGSVLASVVVGKKTTGIGIMGVVCHLKTVCRVPIGQIKGLAVYSLWPEDICGPGSGAPP